MAHIEQSLEKLKTSNDKAQATNSTRSVILYTIKFADELNNNPVFRPITEAILQARQNAPNKVIDLRTQASATLNKIDIEFKKAIDEASEEYARSGKTPPIPTTMEAQFEELNKIHWEAHYAKDKLFNEIPFQIWNDLSTINCIYQAATKKEFIDALQNEDMSKFLFMSKLRKAILSIINKTNDVPFEIDVEALKYGLQNVFDFISFSLESSSRQNLITFPEASFCNETNLISGPGQDDSANLIQTKLDKQMDCPASQLSYDQSNGLLSFPGKDISFKGQYQKTFLGLFFPNSKPLKNSLPIDVIHADVFQSPADSDKRIEKTDKDQVYGVVREINKKTSPSIHMLFFETKNATFRINPKLLT